ncbi:MAG: hypothetical protein II532_04990 [Bacteroidales bacterium]|nr:hypothetical protein [Bacteroidales bacterium]
MTLLCFNPDHDICLADGGTHVTPPKMAALFAQQCAWIMAWCYREGYVLCSHPQPSLPQGAVAVSDIQGLPVDRVIAWGWDATQRQRCIDLGISPTLLPTTQYIEQLRQWQHRTTAAEAMRQLVGQIPSALFPEVPQAFSSLEDAEQYLSTHGDVLFKAPWSGSGQGLRPVTRTLSDNDRGWVLNTIRRQRCVMAERRLDVVQDFAVEYLVDSQRVEKVGYSLFTTQGGAYKSNILLSDDAIRQQLSTFVPLTLLDEVETFLEEWFARHLDTYQGPLGVDMLVYRTPDGHYGLHPLVEFNFRHTMGWVAHTLRQQHPEWDGKRFAVEFGDAEQFLSQPHHILLTPVNAATRYCCSIRY